MKDSNRHNASRCYACINFNPTFNKKKSNVAGYTALLLVTHSAGVEPPRSTSPYIVSVLTGASGFSDAPDVQGPDGVPDIEDSINHKNQTENMDGILRKLEAIKLDENKKHAEMKEEFMKLNKEKTMKNDVADLIWQIGEGKTNVLGLTDQRKKGKEIHTTQ
ncbi:hypothetical protein FQA39_LY01983 [Lamprigera yunnana]|nr:hypothetical protein FQA39_LY01983 [Lamprigera yunnana]